MNIKITGTGSYIPDIIEKNEDFHQHKFLNTDGSSIDHSNEVIVEKFKAITGIGERRYADKSLNTSDIAFYAAQRAIKDADIDQEELDYIIVAHNYGDVKHNVEQSDTVPSIASRVKHLLKIKNPKCVGYDMLFGCPGWIEATIQANAFIKSGIAKKCLVIGAETLSRVIDKHDRDSMIYSDGAGAVVLETSNNGSGIITHESATHALDEAHFIYFGETNNQEISDKRRYIKMYGRKIYEFALNHVPDAMKSCLDKSGIDINEVKKILIHQANEKMDEAIVKRFYKLYGMKMPEDIMPMTINKLGNSSVATVPTLYDMILKGKMNGHSINKGDIILFASVGAGMNINAIVYKN
jgi:3-oxoacyl-[acyl-carrier-protein] synthase III